MGFYFKNLDMLALYLTAIVVALQTLIILQKVHLQINPHKKITFNTTRNMLLKKKQQNQLHIHHVMQVCLNATKI